MQKYIDSDLYTQLTPSVAKEFFQDHVFNLRLIVPFGNKTIQPPEMVFFFFVFVFLCFCVFVFFFFFFFFCKTRKHSEFHRKLLSHSITSHIIQAPFLLSHATRHQLVMTIKLTFIQYSHIISLTRENKVSIVGSLLLPICIIFFIKETKGIYIKSDETE